MSDWEDEQARMRRYADGETAQLGTRSWRQTFSPPDVRLIPPLAEEFRVTGSPEADERARRWALRHRYLLASGPYTCAHGLLMLGCPAFGSCCPELDHTHLWVPCDEPFRPFILTHPYTDEIPGGLRAYARAHGLNVTGPGHPWPGFREDDRWYHQDALPIRLTASNTEVYAWPLSTAAILLLNAWPVKWPDDSELGLEETASP